MADAVAPARGAILYRLIENYIRCEMQRGGTRATIAIFHEAGGEQSVRSLSDATDWLKTIDASDLV